MSEIRIWNRATGAVETEQVYGDALVRWLYGSRVGRALADHVLTGAGPSRLYGTYQSSLLSRRKIAGFIRQFRIDMSEYEDPGFRSFNDFFIRRFRPGARPFAQEPERMPAFAEARYLAWSRIEPEQLFPVKGSCLTPELLLGSAERARPFLGGPLLLARLCPTDYHRYHYPDDGRTLESYPLHGRLHSVNPHALRYKGEIFATNERQVSILETRHFGRLASIEVGALFVGRIVQTHPASEPFSRGAEKGYFLFGGSTVIVLGEPGRWEPDADLLAHTAQGMETLVRIGTAIARRTPSRTPAGAPAGD